MMPLFPGRALVVLLLVISGARGAVVAGDGVLAVTVGTLNANVNATAQGKRAPADMELQNMVMVSMKMLNVASSMSKNRGDLKTDREIRNQLVALQARINKQKRRNKSLRKRSQADTYSVNEPTRPSVDVDVLWFALGIALACFSLAITACEYLLTSCTSSMIGSGEPENSELSVVTARDGMRKAKKPQRTPDYSGTKGSRSGGTRGTFGGSTNCSPKADIHTSGTDMVARNLEDKDLFLQTIYGVAARKEYCRPFESSSRQYKESPKSATRTIRHARELSASATRTRSRGSDLGSELPAGVGGYF
jgi:hypothetical protein